ncbi:hypothetical protein V5070_12850 [Moellerella wisconsensis]
MGQTPARALFPPFRDNMKARLSSALLFEIGTLFLGGCSEKRRDKEREKEKK